MTHFPPPSRPAPPADLRIGDVVVFDTETTGTHADASIVQWAYAAMEPLARITAAEVMGAVSFAYPSHNPEVGRRPIMRVVSEFIGGEAGPTARVVVTPPRAGDAMALAARATHMLPEDAGAPTGDELVPRDVALASLSAWATSVEWYTGYSVEFDAGAVSSNLGGRGLPAPTFDVMKLARAALFHEVEANVLSDTRLDTVFAHVFPMALPMLHELRCIHDAMVDCWLTAKIAVALLQRVGLSVRAPVADLLAYLARPLPYTKWPFGKNVRGKPLDSDPRFTRWFLADHGDAAQQMRAQYPDLVECLRARAATGN